MLQGHVEVDETFVGGKAQNMHYRKRTVEGRSAVGKAIVMGLLDRHGEVRASVVPNNKKRTVQYQIRANVVTSSAVYTDALRCYDGLGLDHAHKVIDHAESYVEGEVHTNGMENFWALFKRWVKRTYVSVDPFHLQRFLDEEVFRFNNRKVNDDERFALTVANVSGKRLTYKQLAQSSAWS